MNEKLIRDLVPDVARKRGTELRVRAAGPDEMSALLVAKLEEEALEVGEAASGLPEELLAELADVLEVVNTLAALHGWSRSDLERAQARKTALYGAFTRGHVLNLDRVT